MTEAEQIRFAEQVAAVGAELAGPIDPGPWATSVGIPEAGWKFTMTAMAEGIIESAAEDGELPTDAEKLLRFTSVVMTSGFQIGAEWARRYAPERQT